MGEQFGNFIPSIAITERFNHDHQFGIGLQFGFVKIEVMTDGIEIDFKHRFVRFLLQNCHDIFKMKMTCAFNEYRFLFKNHAIDDFQKGLGRWESQTIGKLPFVGTDCWPNGNHAVDMIGHH